MCLMFNIYLTVKVDFGFSGVDLRVGELEAALIFSRILVNDI